MTPDYEVLIDFSAHGPDRGQLFVPSHPTRSAPPLANPIEDLRGLGARTTVQQRVLEALTEEWALTYVVAARVGMPYERTRHALRRLHLDGLVERRVGVYGKVQTEWRI